MNLIQLFDLSFAGRANETALEYSDRGGHPRTATFGELDRDSSRLARLLQQRGFAAGDRLCVHLANCVEMVHLYVACLKLGVIFVPINVLYKEREVRHIVSDAAPRAVIAEGALPGGGETWESIELAADAAAQSGERVYTPLEGDAPAAIVYTSGTTGPSKGAILTHNNFAANALNLITCWRIGAADRLLMPLPLFHVHGLGNALHCWLIAGFRMRLLERFEHRKARQEFLDFRPSLFFGVPAMYVRLLELPGEAAREIGGFARLFVSGSAPLPPQVLEEFEGRFGSRILERYGMTETLMNMSNPYEGERRAGTVGFPLPGVSARIRNQDGSPAADGETGELHLKGPNVFPGYWRRPEATEAAFSEGYFRTGDLASRSADGYYTLHGRRSDLIISGGFNIYPREIEEFLLEQPEVKEAVVVGAPDRVRGEVPVAYIVSAADFDPAVLEGRCRAVLASFKVPRAFVRVDELPRTALGKIQKHLLPPSSTD